MSENTDILNQIQNAFNELKATNEQKLGEMATKNAVDTLIETKMVAINEAITDLQKKAQRPKINGVDVDPAVAEHKSAFDKWARKGAGEFELEEIQKKAVTITGTDATGLAAGGFLMPKTIEAGIYSALDVLSPIRAEATVINVSSDDYRFLSSNGLFDCGWVGETDARPETATHTLIESKIPMGEIYANPAASQRALDDAAFDLDAYMVDQTARAFAVKENSAFVIGDGVNKPQGILTTSGITSVKTGVAYNAGTGAGMPTSADAYLQMVYTLPSPYRTGAKFALSSTAQVSVRTIKDSTGGYIWQPSAIDGQPDQLFGHAVLSVEDMPNVAANGLVGVFGNFAMGYLIADRIGIRTTRDPFTKKPYVLFYSTKRVGGMVKDKAAFVSLKVSA